MKLAHLLACGFAALSLAGSAYAGTTQDAQPSDESVAQVATAEQAQGKVQAHEVSAETKRAVEAKINLNKASARTIAKAKILTLMQAKAVVNFRKKHGAFKSIDDLAKVNKQGIDENFVKENHDKLESSFDLK